MPKPPLVVDLDGTLIHSDVLLESALGLLKQNLLYLVMMCLWLARGKAVLKAQIARRVELDVTTLPYDDAMLDFVREERAGGRETALATASHQRYAERVAEHTGAFDRVFASDDEVNLSAGAKARILVDTYGERGFVYAGNARPDLQVWDRAAAAIPAGSRRGLIARAQRCYPVERAFPWPRPGPMVYVKALRAHQWIKNLLVFLPVLAAHEIGNPAATLASLLAFVAFNACASSVYLLNDLLDLPADRRHRSKKNRPFAAGTLPLEQGVLLIPLLLAIALLVSLTLPPTFVLVLLLYYLITTAYSFKLKRVMMLDVVILAGLYTIRVVAGSAATEIPLTYWLFAFSMFIFLSLALVKRYAELIALRGNGAADVAEGRGYQVGDLDVLSSLGAASGYLAVLVLALYISNPETQILYGHPQVLWGICPVLLYWISRMWIITHRGAMTDDPIVFAVEDRNSLLCGLLVLGLMSWAL